MTALTPQPPYPTFGGSPSQGEGEIPLEILFNNTTNTSVELICLYYQLRS